MFNPLYRTRKEQRRADAQERQAEAAKRTPEEQLARLDLKFGPGLGAKKERAKLAARIAARQQSVTVATGAAPKKSKGKKGKKSNAPEVTPQG